ncbi:MAG: hypothetical protein EBT95_01290 [Verrucomicrobia bacterium]|nr:hypothetical protein [Verrucomicrobiota bacterium]
MFSCVSPAARSEGFRGTAALTGVSSGPAAAGCGEGGFTSFPWTAPIGARLEGSLGDFTGQTRYIWMPATAKTKMATAERTPKPSRREVRMGSAARVGRDSSISGRRSRMESSTSAWLGWNSRRMDLGSRPSSRE